jgi:hypothetical protein
VKSVPVARKLNTIEERHQELSSLFRILANRNKGQNPDKAVLSSSPGEDFSCSSEATQDNRTAPRPKLFFSWRKLQE